MSIVQEAEQIIAEPLREKPKEVKRILYGKKVILFAFEPQDLQHFVRLHRNDPHGYMHKYCLKKMTEPEAMSFMAAAFMTGQLVCWSVYLKQNSLRNMMDNKCAGFIYLTNLEPFAANISGVMDTAVMKGLLKHIRRGDETFAEDAIKTLVNYCFTDLGMSRIETSVLSNNRRALALDRKCGFVQEGVLRESFQMDGKFYDTVLLSILKREWHE